MMKFNYYYGTDADKYSFFRIPKYLMIADEFALLSIQAKVLYGLLLDRMGLSKQNQWIDEENKVFIIYQISEIQKDMNISKKQAIEYLKELENNGLIKKRSRGNGLPNLLYLKNFMVKQSA